jgi:Lon protease-like protein
VRRIPIFPLPGVVLFPETLLPLHIFEPRYRTMIASALEGDRLIGMTMIDPRSDPAGDAPPVLPVGGAGVIVEHERLDDGRFNIILQGRFRFRIVREEPSSPYRAAAVRETETVPFPTAEEEADRVAAAVAAFEGLRNSMSLPPLPAEELSAERLCGELALRLNWTPPQLQELLEVDSLPDRFRRICEQLKEWEELAAFLRPWRPGEIRPTRN